MSRVAGLGRKMSFAPTHYYGVVDKLLVFLYDLAKNQQIVFICILFHSGNRVFLAFSGILLDGS